MTIFVKSWREEVAIRDTNQSAANRHFFPFMIINMPLSFRGFIQNIFCTPAVMTTNTV